MNAKGKSDYSNDAPRPRAMRLPDPSFESLSRAWSFAARKHQGQLYPGSELPYLTHIGMVLMVLLPALRAGDSLEAETAMLCALLHDTVEDTDTTIEEIRELFGEDVAAGVAALTKDKTKKGEAAMLDSLERIRRQPREVWLVKLADRIANLGTPPAHWPKEKRLAYAMEGELILEALGSASGFLAGHLRTRVTNWKTEQGGSNSL
jgi:(p)ppGpp synthase/HD superfamily hydrolase